MDSNRKTITKDEEEKEENVDIVPQILYNKDAIYRLNVLIHLEALKNFFSEYHVDLAEGLESKSNIVEKAHQIIENLFAKIYNDPFYLINL